MRCWATFSQLDAINAWQYVTLLLVSDHGMIDVNRYISLKSMLDELEIDYIISAGPAVAHLFIDNEQIGQRQKICFLTERI